MVSFIVATYNGEKYISDTIHSALNQKDVDVEVIIIDDYSNDNTYEIVKEIANNDTRIVLLRNSSNMGFCKTVNRGLENAKGEWIIILDQDDLIESTHCKYMLEFISSNTAMVFCDNYLINGEGKKISEGNRCVHNNIEIRDLLYGNIVPVQGLLIRKSLLKKVGGYPINRKFPHYGEYHTWIRMAEEGDIVFCNKVRAYYRRHDKNISNTFADKKTKLKLEKYVLSCRMQFLKSKKLSVKDKIYVFLSSIYRVSRAQLSCFLHD